MNALQQMAKLQDSLGQQMAKLQDSPTMRSLQQMASLQDSPTMQALQQMAKLQDSSTVKALREFSNLPFSSAERERIFSELDSFGRTQIEPGEYPYFPIDQDIQLEIQRELEGNRDYKALSESARAFLVYFYHHYLLQILLSLVTQLVIAPMITTYTQRVQTELQENKTPSEVRSYVRKPVHEVNKKLLKGYRVVMGS